MSRAVIPLIPDNLTHEETVNEINKRLKEIDWLLSGFIDDKNIRRNSITTQLLQANSVTTEILAAGSVTANELAANSVSADKLQANSVTASKIDVDQLSAITANLGTVNAGTINGLDINGSEITGGTVQTDDDGARVVMENGRIYIYQSNDTLRMVIDATLSPPKINFYDSSGVLSASIYHSGGTFLIAGEDGTSISDLTALTISSPSLVIASPNLTGSPKINGGTTLGTRSQSNSSATTVADLVDDFNDLLDDLRAMKILSP